MASSDNDFSSPLGWRGLAYIAPLDEFGPSDQTDINRTVFLDPLDRWSIIHELVLIGRQTRAGAQGGRAGALPPSPIGLPFVLVASGHF